MTLLDTVTHYEYFGYCAECNTPRAYDDYSDRLICYRDECKLFNVNVPH